MRVTGLTEEAFLVKGVQTGRTQPELLGIMAQQVLRKVVCRLQSSFFTVMIDEATDVSNVEQVVVVIRHVGDDLSVQEEFIGLYQTESLKARSLALIIKDRLQDCYAKTLKYNCVEVNVMMGRV